MNWNSYGYPPPPPPAHDGQIPFILHLTEAIRDLSHSSGRVETRLEHIDKRLETGDARFDAIEAKIDSLAENSRKPDPSPSKIEATRKLAEVAIPAIKEAWPFLAVAGAGTAKALGYDLSWLVGP